METTGCLSHFIPFLFNMAVILIPHQDGKKEGSGKLSLVSGEKYDGEWSLGLKHVSAAFVFPLIQPISIFRVTVFTLATTQSATKGNGTQTECTE
jgi:hypothetical protein